MTLIRLRPGRTGGVEIASLREALDEVLDQAVMYHAYTDYMRDYEVIVHKMADPRTGIQPAYLRYLFKFCVEVDVRTTLPPDTWRASLDERLTDAQLGPHIAGYVWGVRWQEAYPGAEVVADAPRAQTWADRIGIEFHEVRLELNAHTLTLIFSDLEVRKLPADYTPFVVAAQ